jgi:spermidine synthase
MNKKIIFPIFAISGASALIYEMLWIRPLSLVFGNSIYAMGTIVFSFIVGLAIGSFVISKYVDKIDNPLRAFAFLQIGIGLSSIFVLYLVNGLPEYYVSIYQMIEPHTEIFIAVQVIMSSLVLIIPASLIGANFPLVMKFYSKNLGDIGKDVGKIDGVNSLGAAIGVLLVSFYMMSEFGVLLSMQIVATINISLGAGMLFFLKSMPKERIITVSVIALLVVTLGASYDVETLNFAVFAIKNTLQEGEFVPMLYDHKIIYHKDSFYQSIIVEERNDFLVLKLDGLPQCNTSKRVEDGLFRLGGVGIQTFANTFDHHKASNAEILNIGLGCGTITQFLQNRNFDVTTIEIDEYVIDASKIIYPNLDDSNIHVADARNWLLRNDQTFDIIITEPNQPYSKNVGNLFSVEFFELMKSRLNDGGMVVQWFPYWALPEYEADVFVHTFKSVFPHVIAYQMEVGNYSQIILIGSETEIKQDYSISGFLNMDWKRLDDLDLELNTDDRPIVEFSSALKLIEVGN